MDLFCDDSVPRATPADVMDIQVQNENPAHIRDLLSLLDNMPLVGRKLTTAINEAILIFDEGVCAGNKEIDGICKEIQILSNGERTGFHDSMRAMRFSSLVIQAACALR